MFISSTCNINCNSRCFFIGWNLGNSKGFKEGYSWGYGYGTYHVINNADIWQDEDSYYLNIDDQVYIYE